MACLIAARCSAAYGLSPPAAQLSCSQEHEGLPGRPGAVSLSARTLIAVVEDDTASTRSG